MLYNLQLRLATSCASSLTASECLYAFDCVCVCMFVCMCVYVYIYVCLCVCVRVCALM